MSPLRGSGCVFASGYKHFAPTELPVPFTSSVATLVCRAPSCDGRPSLPPSKRSELVAWLRRAMPRPAALPQPTPLPRQSRLLLRHAAEYVFSASRYFVHPVAPANGGEGQGEGVPRSSNTPSLCLPMRAGLLSSRCATPGRWLTHPASLRSG